MCILQSVCSQCSTELSTVSPKCSLPHPHLNQQTQCRTKHNGFYCASLFVTVETQAQSQQQERNRSEREEEESKTEIYFLLLFISSLPPAHHLSPSLSLFTRIKHSFLFLLQLFRLYLCIREGESDFEKRRGRETIIVQYSHS